jgi:adenylosuccinate lyase
MSDYDRYESPLTERYASDAMARLFSARFRATTYRRLWVALAEAEHELGLPVTASQVEELRANVEPVDFELIAQIEREIRHDVMAHIHAYGAVCPNAAAIIHLGATSAYVSDNTDLIQMREGLGILRRGLLNVTAALADFARRTKHVPTLGYTHFQPAQPTTVGKRACLWIQDFLLDWQDLTFRLERLSFRGVKGTTGTQASFLDLFGGDHEKVRRLDRLVAEKMGFADVLPTSGQTYTRKLDSQVAGVLAGIAQSAHKLSNDMRLLQHLKEVEEPSEEGQVGSSAMPYKQNPMRMERVASLARYVITTAQSPYFTAASQWFERTLDDSANKRIAIPEMFLATDAILILSTNVARGFVVHESVIKRHLDAELPFMATENVLMEAVKRGGNRQELHERIRRHAREAGRRVKDGDGVNDMVERIAGDPAFALDAEALAGALDGRRYVGRAPEQVDEYLSETVEPLLEEHRDQLGGDAELRV